MDREANQKAGLTALTISERQAARVLGLSVRTLFTLRLRHEIPFLRINGRVLYSVAALEKWVESQTVAAVTNT